MHKPRDPNFAARIRESFDKQQFMETIGAELASIEPGSVAIRLPFDGSLTQQDGFLHAGVVSAIADNACGYSALTLTEAGADVLAVEFKVNFMKPAAGEYFVATGNVLRAGRTLAVCEAKVCAHEDDDSTLIASMQGTMYVAS